MYDKCDTLHLELEEFEEKKTVMLILLLLLSTINGEHLPMPLVSVELDVSCGASVMKKTRTIVSAREEESISVNYLGIF